MKTRADQPVTIYDEHKLMAEHDLKAAAADGTVCGATLRLANVYGPGGHGRTNDRDILNRMIAAAVRGEPLTVYGAGEYVRDYVFVDDVVDAFLMAAAHPERVNGRHYVIGSGRGIDDSRGLRAGGRARRSPYRKASAGHHRRTARAIVRNRTTALRRRLVTVFAATGWCPAWSLSDGIDRTIEACACA